MGSLVGSTLVLEDVTLSEGLLAIAMLTLVQFLLTLGAVSLNWLERIIKSRPRILFDDNYCEEAMPPRTPARCRPFFGRPRKTGSLTNPLSSPADGMP